MERERPAPVAEAAAAPAETDRLAVLLGHAREATGLDRMDKARHINRLLRQMRAPGNEALEADVVLAGLEQKLFHDLVDGTGADCRKEAVETLLATGFPHALKVSPDDLAYARAPAVRPAPAPAEEVPVQRGGLPAAFAIASAAQLSGAVMSASLGGSSVAAGIGGLTLGAGAAWLWQARDPGSRGAATLVAAIGAGIGVICAATAGAPLLGAGAGILAGYGFLKLLIYEHRWK